MNSEASEQSLAQVIGQPVFSRPATPTRPLHDAVDSEMTVVAAGLLQTPSSTSSNPDLSPDGSSSLPVLPLPGGAAPPASVTEDGYLGDCLSDGGNEKNFPIPLDRLKKFSSAGSQKCPCHPLEESDDNTATTTLNDSGKNDGIEHILINVGLEHHEHYVSCV